MYQEILDFWFTELTPKQWWGENYLLDKMIKDRFGHFHNQAVKGELWGWRETPEGSLSEIIIIDQFSRNIYRDQPEAFLYDPIALVLAQNAIAKQFDKKLDNNKRSFLYLPFMHSESVKIHEEAARLFNIPGLEDSYEYELKHKVIIDRFGRYPHRNKILGRNSSKEELSFLQEPNSSF